jgi:hypothetical protein
MTKFEHKAYGITAKDIREQYMNSTTAKCSGLEMVVAGLLSDAQELVSFDNKQALDQARQNMNIAKFILFEMMDQRGHSV